MQRHHRSGTAYLPGQTPPTSTTVPSQPHLKEKIPQMVCKFEELKGEFLIRREIGRGSYGVVFKALRNDEGDTDVKGKKR